MPKTLLRPMMTSMRPRIRSPQVSALLLSFSAWNISSAECVPVRMTESVLPFFATYLPNEFPLTFAMSDTFPGFAFLYVMRTSPISGTPGFVPTYMEFVC